jgi:cyclopropane fatty-acyl-phospholipid synthase-like methyltransferase
MREFNLLRRYPSGKRDVKKRAHDKTDEHIRISRQYGFDYFDGSREYGYGGYRYDGRWQPIAQDIVAHWGLKPGMRVLDIGCAKGFLVKDLMKACPGIEVFGFDISEYALMHCEPEVVGRLHLGNMKKLPFPDKSFDAVVCINTLHNLERQDCIAAIKEIERVGRDGKSYIQVDSYRTPEEREIFVDWVLTAHTHDYPEGWRKLFEEAGYAGDYYWTLILG